MKNFIFPMVTVIAVLFSTHANADCFTDYATHLYALTGSPVDVNQFNKTELKKLKSCVRIKEERIQASGAAGISKICSKDGSSFTAQYRKYTQVENEWSKAAKTLIECRELKMHGCAESSEKEAEYASAFKAAAFSFHLIVGTLGEIRQSAFNEFIGCSGIWQSNAVLRDGQVYTLP